MSNVSIYPSTKPMSYVYYGVHKSTGQFYYGYRLGNIAKNRSSSEDFGLYYRTTSKIIKPIFDEYNWTILAEFWDEPGEDIGQNAYDHTTTRNKVNLHQI